jgi:D-cysteine desulfhydrase
MRGPARALGLGHLPEVDLRDDWYGPGYGHGTPAASAAIARAAESGLVLESTYTGKAFAAFLARLAACRGPVLFWNTFNSHPLPGG